LQDSVRTRMILKISVKEHPLCLLPTSIQTQRRGNLPLEERRTAGGRQRGRDAMEDPEQEVQQCKTKEIKMKSLQWIVARARGKEQHLS